MWYEPPSTVPQLANKYVLVLVLRFSTGYVINNRVHIALCLLTTLEPGHKQRQ